MSAKSRLDVLLGEVGETAKAFETRAVASQRELALLRSQLADALEGLHELRTLIRTKDQIIEELQELRAREGSR